MAGTLQPIIASQLQTPPMGTAVPPGATFWQPAGGNELLRLPASPRVIEYGPAVLNPALGFDGLAHGFVLSFG